MQSSCSIIKQIKEAEDEIYSNYKRIEALERKLNSSDIPENREEEIRNELKELRKLLKTNEQQLSTLHGHNRQTFAISAVLFFICFLVYGIYILINGKDF